MTTVRKRSLNRIAAALMLFATVAGLWWFNRDEDVAKSKVDAPIPHHATSVKPKSSVPPSSESGIRFELQPSSATGVSFEYYGSPSDENYMTEQNGGGVALFDADGDGRLDLFLPNGSHFKRPASEVGASASQKLFHQSGDWQFEDVTELAGLTAFGFGQGCAAADYNNDGFCDLFVTSYEGNRLWCNNGDGTFSDVTQGSGVADDLWGTSAAFADLDGDGNLELYVTKYVDWTPLKPKGRRIPSPMEFNGLPDQLYRNRGDGQFESIGDAAGIAIAGAGKGLAVAITDLDGDHRPDIYVANDTTRNFLFRNLGGLRFEDIGVSSGCAVSQDGSIGSSMGIAVGDYNRDGIFDLFVTNFSGEVVDAFTGLGAAGFFANNAELGIDPVSRPLLNFGIVLTDFDSDLWPDLFFANGHLWDDDVPGHQYRMRPSLLRNSRGKRFNDVSANAGRYFQERWLGRSVAVGDVDNDGDPDLVVTHLLAPPALLRNDSPQAGHVLQLRIIGVHSARQPLGTRVEVVVGDQTIATHIPSGESFQASHDDRLLIPVGSATMVNEVRVYWQGKDPEIWRELSVNERNDLVEGTGDTHTQTDQ
jgi:hypothetical protein